MVLSAHVYVTADSQADSVTKIITSTSLPDFTELKIYESYKPQRAGPFDIGWNTKDLIQGYKKRINWLNNKLQHKTDHLPPMWWPVQICFHPLHPRRLALHQELHNRDLVHTSINILGFKNVHKNSWESSNSSITVSHLLVTVCGFQNFNLIRMNDLRGTCDGLLSPYLHPQSWSWLTQGWVLRLPHCFWPKPETRTPPRHWGPLQWLSLCYHQLSQALRKNRHHLDSKNI